MNDHITLLQVATLKFLTYGRILKKRMATDPNRFRIIGGSAGTLRALMNRGLITEYNIDYNTYAYALTDEGHRMLSKVKKAKRIGRRYEL